ncbi:putative carboxypeptidase S1 [Hypoxylon trugodes]|uniref:putative carboxypeptidase S1 n=1 Tax=Hypoxylon trugodes TaxID=326681 RepID=UPI00219FE074|nr:putative carboxypeptidase S1 [Hypoxylon trugodes]KAI1384015.1 putative carboxypeptidase S1 [Hypoxylon trugodes]
MRWILEFAIGALLVTSTTARSTSLRAVNKRYVEERNGVNYNVFEHAATNSKLSFVENSGICETTPGVNQYSGYITVGPNMNMWFWFFEARRNPQKAPLVAYWDGGPGTAAEYGLFTQNGPCHFVNNETEPSLNPYSFNEYANMLYIDQPIGTGFSYGNATVNSTKSAAPYVWNLLQAFYDSFPEYESRDFSAFSQSYGGHFGPEFVRYIVDQNAAIERGDIQGTDINVVALGVSNGWFDSAIQEKANIEFAYKNQYRQLINESFYEELLDSYETICKPAFAKCTATGTTEDCFTAYMNYTNEIEWPILASAREGVSDFYLGDIRVPYSRPPTTHVEYLQRADVQKALGARVNYTDSSSAGPFIYSGDDPISFIPALSDLVKAGVRVLIWTGDADYLCNWPGTLDVADAIPWSGQEIFANQTLVPYTLHGTEKGTFKTLDNLVFMRIYEAGHNLPFYQPEVSLQIFRQTMEKGGLVPT